MITTIDGTVLCNLTGVEIERHESAPTKVEQRYDLVIQPHSLKDRSTTGEELVICAEPPSYDARPLYRYLDDLALRISENTLGRVSKVGSTVRILLFTLLLVLISDIIHQLDRQRYVDRIQSMINRHNSRLPTSDEEIRQLRVTWPETMELTDRVASVQEGIIQSSKVCTFVPYIV